MVSHYSYLLLLLLFCILSQRPNWFSISWDPTCSFGDMDWILWEGVSTCPPWYLVEQVGDGAWSRVTWPYPLSFHIVPIMLFSLVSKEEREIQKSPAMALHECFLDFSSPPISWERIAHSFGSKNRFEVVPPLLFSILHPTNSWWYNINIEVEAHFGWISLRIVVTVEWDI